MTCEHFCTQYKAEYLTSRKGNTVVAFAKLKDTKEREKAGLFLAEGIKLTEEAMSCHNKTTQVYALVVSETALDTVRALRCAEQALALAIKIYLVTAEVLEKISTEQAPQGVIAVCHRTFGRIQAFIPEGRYLLLDTIQDPGNLGTILRSAAAFGISGVVLYGCADPTSPKTVRASMGAVFRCPLLVTESLVDCMGMLKSQGHRILSAALSEDCLCAGKTELLATDCVVIGNEGHGISEEVLQNSDGILRIPMRSDTESLNASVAASLLMWEYYRTFEI